MSRYHLGKRHKAFLFVLAERGDTGLVFEDITEWDRYSLIYLRHYGLIRVKHESDHPFADDTIYVITDRGRAVLAASSL